MRVSLQHLSLWLGIIIFLAGCRGVPISQRAARATAVSHGCWPYGVVQPRPSPTLRARPTSPLAPPAPVRAMDQVLTPTVTPWPVFPTCEPAPDQPTVTPQPPTPPPTVAPATPQRPRLIGGPFEVADTAGVVTSAGMAFAVNPVLATPVVAFISYGWSNAVHDDGLVWVRTQDSSGAWWDAQTVNPQPVTQTYGGLGVAVTPTDPMGEIHVIYGQGDAGAALWHVRSQDNGQHWSTPQPLERTGRVFALEADAAGGLHLLINGPAVFTGELQYGYLPPASASWQWHAMSLPDQDVADLAILPDPHGGMTRWIVTASDVPPDLAVYASADGATWQRHPIAYDRHLPQSLPVVRPTILVMPRGEGLIAVAWGSYGRGGVFASISTDGGQTFSAAERIAMHVDDGAISSDWDYGIEPTLLYDVVTDQLAASWIEIETDSPDMFPPPVRSYLAFRDLKDSAAAGHDWLEARTPDNRDVVVPPILDPARKALLYGSPDGRRHWMLLLDERNQQYRLTVEPITLTGLVDRGQS